MVGPISNLNEGKLTYGFLLNDQITDCPVQSEKWIEWYDSSWEYGDAEINCE